MSQATSTSNLPPYNYPKQTNKGYNNQYYSAQYSLKVLLTSFIVDWAELEALDISKLDQPGGKDALAS